MLFNGEIAETQFNAAIFGGATHPWDFKSGCHSLFYVENLLKSFGLTIDSKKVEGYTFYVTARRP